MAQEGQFLYTAVNPLHVSHVLLGYTNYKRDKKRWKIADHPLILIARADFFRHFQTILKALIINPQTHYSPFFSMQGNQNPHREK